MNFLVRPQLDFNTIQQQMSANPNSNSPPMKPDEINIANSPNETTSYVCASCKGSFAIFEDSRLHYTPVYPSKPVHSWAKRKDNCLYCILSSDYKNLTTHHYHTHRTSTFVLSRKEQPTARCACNKFTGTSNDDTIHHSSSMHPDLPTEFSRNIDTSNLISVMSQSTLDKLLRIGIMSRAYKCSLCKGTLYTKEDVAKHEKGSWTFKQEVYLFRTSKQLFSIWLYSMLSFFFLTRRNS